MEGLSAAEAATLVLAEAALAAPQPAVRRFVLLNRSREVWPFQASMCWDEGALVGHSGAGSVDPHGPYAQWLSALAPALWSREAGRLHADALNTPAAAAWSTWWPAEALWLPATQPRSGWLIVRELPFADAELVALQRWWALWQSIDQARQVSAPVPWWRRWQQLAPRTRRRQIGRAHV